MSAKLLSIAMVGGVVFTACRGTSAAITQLMDARQRASHLHVAFTKAADASNRAVLADTDSGAVAAADEARNGRQLVEQDLKALQPILVSLGYAADLRDLEAFAQQFGQYRALDDEILALTVEHTNLKAQRLSCGAGRDAADAVRTAAARLVGVAPATVRPRAEALAARARIAVLEVQVLQAPHIAESGDTEMTRLEGEMNAAAALARTALDELQKSVAQSAAQAAGVIPALDRFLAVNNEIIKLSRRNSDVRSLALSLGRKRTTTAVCEDQLRALDDALATHHFTATR